MVSWKHSRLTKFRLFDAWPCVKEELLIPALRCESHSVCDIKFHSRSHIFDIHLNLFLTNFIHVHNVFWSHSSHFFPLAFHNHYSPFLQIHSLHIFTSFCFISVFWTTLARSVQVCMPGCRALPWGKSCSSGAIVGSNDSTYPGKHKLSLSPQGTSHSGETTPIHAWM